MERQKSLQLIFAFQITKYFLFSLSLFIVYWLIAWLTDSVCIDWQWVSEWVSEQFLNGTSAQLIDSFQSSLSFRVIKWIDFICK